MAPTADLWVDAAQLGLAHPDLARSGVALFDLALAALRRARVDPDRIDLVECYADRWVRRGRSPADDRLDDWRHNGDLFPPAESARSTLATSERSA